jgi:hypothetical protein
MLTLFQHMYMCFESQVIAHDVKPKFVIFFFAYAEYRMVIVDNSLSLLLVYFMCIDGCHIYLGVKISSYVPML